MSTYLKGTIRNPLSSIGLTRRLKVPQYVLIESEFYLNSHPNTDDDKMEWKILISGEDTLRKITDRLESQGVNCTILEIAHLTAKNDLTARQEQIAKIALELGYFEFPKKIKLEELSSRLGISAGTLSEILRRAEKNILTKYFRGS